MAKEPSSHLTMAFCILRRYRYCAPGNGMRASLPVETFSERRIGVVTEYTISAHKKGVDLMKSKTLSILIGFVTPMVAIVLLFPFWNKVEPFILGFPFNYFWIFSWLFLTAGCLAIAFRIDPDNDEDA